MNVKPVLLTFAATLCFIIAGIDSGVFAQIDGFGGTPGRTTGTGFGTTTGTTGNTGFGTTGNTGFGGDAFGGGGGLGGGGFGQEFGAASFGGQQAPEMVTGGTFVGSAIVNLPDGGYVGATAESIGSSSGGMGGGGGGGGGGGFAGGGGARGGFGGGGGGAGNSNAVIVTRPNQIRSRVVMSFQPRPVSTVQMSNRFNRRIRTMPRVRATGNAGVSIQNGTAFIRGTVRSPAEAQAIERQLRLEPGVRRIVNQTQVGF